MNQKRGSETLDNEHNPANPLRVENDDRTLRLFISGPTGVELTGHRRQRLATLALANQEFGFSQGDAEFLSSLAERIPEDAIGHRSRLQNLAKRIQRLLPTAD